MLLREATSEIYGPGSILIILIFHHFIIALLFYFTFYFTLHLYTKNTKNIIYHLYQISLS